jgi:hypothetical protein
MDSDELLQQIWDLETRVEELEKERKQPCEIFMNPKWSLHKFRDFYHEGFELLNSVIEEDSDSVTIPVWLISKTMFVHDQGKYFKVPEDSRFYGLITLLKVDRSVANEVLSEVYQYYNKDIPGNCMCFRILKRDVMKHIVLRFNFSAQRDSFYYSHSNGTHKARGDTLDSTESIDFMIPETAFYFYLDKLENKK